jgi:hypothetical protein
MSLRRPVIGVVLAMLAGAAAAYADDAQNLPVSIEKRLQSFDPAAVAAARHYFASPARKTSLEAMLPNIMQAMSVALDRANPGIDPEKRKKALQLAQEAVTDKLDLLIDLGMISALEVLSKDELIALDQFYSTPVGQSIQMKMPQLTARLPATMQVVMPLVIEDMRAKLKTNGLEVKL